MYNIEKVIAIECLPKKKTRNSRNVENKLIQSVEKNSSSIIILVYFFSVQVVLCEEW